jgi:hypothetical protein
MFLWSSYSPRQDQKRRKPNDAHKGRNIDLLSPCNESDCNPPSLSPSRLHSKKDNPRDKMPPISVVSCKKAELVNSGYRDFEDWASRPGHVYIGRNMSLYVPGAKGSKWGNPFPLKRHSLDECLSLYEAHVRASPPLWQALLAELGGAVQLGCWCHPSGCHGDVLVRLIDEQRTAAASASGSPALRVPAAGVPSPLPAGDTSAARKVIPGGTVAAIPKKRRSKRSRQGGKAAPELQEDEDEDS